MTNLEKLPQSDPRSDKKSCYGVELYRRVGHPYAETPHELEQIKLIEQYEAEHVPELISESARETASPHCPNC